MALPDVLQTILSTHAEQLAFLLGIVLAGIIVYVADTRLGYLVGVLVLFPVVVPLLPIEIAGEWHYWPAASVIVFLFGLYKLGPSTPFSRRFR